MGRLFAEVIFPLLLLAGFVYTIIRVTKLQAKKYQIRKIARSAPEMLRFENVDSKVVDILVSQRQQLSTGADLVSRMLSDQAMLIPSEYADPLQEWLSDYRKELQK